MVDLARTTDLESEQRQRLQSTLDSMIDPLILMDAVRDDRRRARRPAVHGRQPGRDRLQHDPAGGADRRPPPGPVPGPARARSAAAVLPHDRDRRADDPRRLRLQPRGPRQERRYDIRAARCGDGIALTWRDVTERHQATQAVGRARAAVPPARRELLRRHHPGRPAGGHLRCGCRRQSSARSGGGPTRFSGGARPTSSTRMTCRRR